MSMLLEFKKGVRELVLPTIGQEIPLIVLETVEALWDDERQPQLYKRRKTKLGWEFLFTLPRSVCFRDFAAKEEYFRDAIGDVTTSIKHAGKFAILTIYTKPIETFYPYNASDIDFTGKILPFPVGYTHEGLITEDLAKIPHVLIGGITGGGKSNAIHVIVNTLLNRARIALIDLKMSEYNYLENHVLLVTEQPTASQLLSRLVVEMRKRQLLLKDARCVNIEKYNKKNKPLDYIVLVIDELAELTDEKSQENFETLLRLCRSTGICIIAATQRPDAQTFRKFGQSKANFRGRLSFRVADTINSKIILDSPEAANIPNIPGRAIWKLDKTIEVQTPYLDPEGVNLIEQPSKISVQGLLDR